MTKSEYFCDKESMMIFAEKLLSKGVIFCCYSEWDEENDLEFWSIEYTEE